MADTLSAHGLFVPALTPETQKALRKVMPSYGASSNPVDVTAQGSNTGPASMTAMEHLADSDEIDMLVLVTSLASQTRASLDAERIRATAMRCGKPMTVWTYTLPSEFGRASAADCGLFVHGDLRNVGVAMSKLAGYAEAQSRSIPNTPALVGIPPLAQDLPNILPEYAAKQALSHFLPPAQEALALTAAEAVEAADRVGYPVALKIQSPDLPHKTEAGGVRLGLADATAVRRAYEAIMRDVLLHNPKARIDGIAVQLMAPKGHELVVGMINDPTFGPIMMVGLGGVTVELFGDVAHCPAPVDEAEAERMIRSLRSAPLLTGFRGSRPADLRAICALIARLSDAALAYADRIAEMEFNPVILHSDGSGLTIADALVTLFPASRPN
jgi:acyl-CoA synthetase (NDP forming)